MSGYLGHLIARTFGAEPAVRPRVRSSFEPEAEAAVAAPEPFAALIEEPPTAEAPRDIEPVPPLRDEPTLLPPQVEQPEPLRHVRVPAPSLPEAAISEIPAPFAPQPRAIEPVSRQTGVSRSGADESRTREAPVAPAARAHPAEKSPGPTKPRVIAPARPVPRAATPFAEEMKASPDTAPSIVRVTIGRVDVRANFSPAPPARRASEKAAPKLSLEDYLKSRNGGAR